VGVSLWARQPCTSEQERREGAHVPRDNTAVTFYLRHFPPEHYRSTSLIKKRNPLLGPFHRLMPRVLRGSCGGERFLTSEVPLCNKKMHDTDGAGSEE
jgi:hypothetical protein